MDLKILVLAIGVIMASVILINITIKLCFKEVSEDTRVNKFDRRSQLKGFGQGSAIKTRIDDYVNHEMKLDDRRKKELLLKQAGSKMTITDLYINSAITAVVCSAIIGVILKNPIAAIAMFVVGINIPKSIVTLKRNSRVNKLDSQVGAFIRMSVKRYYVTNNFIESVEATMLDFDGQQPITGELKQLLSEIELGYPITDALDGMAKRTASPYMKLFANNYKVANNIGTQEMKEKLLDGVINKYEKDIKLKSKLKREIRQPVLEGFLMMLIVPVTFVMQAIYDNTYVDFMINNIMGKVALAGVIVLLGVSMWLLVAKVGAPLIKEED